MTRISRRGSFLVQVLFIEILRRRVHEHAHVLPTIPIDRDNKCFRLRGVVMRESIEAGIAGAVVDLAETAEQRATRRTQRQEIKCSILKDIAKNTRTLNF